MNPNEKMWSELKRTMQETWPVFPARNSDELWTLMLDAWDEVGSSTRYIRSMVEFMTGRIKSVVEAEGFWTSCKRGQFLKTAPLMDKELRNFHLYA